VPKVCRDGCWRPTGVGRPICALRDVAARTLAKSCGEADQFAAGAEEHRLEGIGGHRADELTQRIDDEVRQRLDARW